MAGLVEGAYPGVHQSAEPRLGVGVNVPDTGGGTVGVHAYSGVSSAFRDVYLAGAGPHYFQMGSVQFGNVNSNYLWGNGLWSEDAWNIDVKIDDGMPGTGRVLATDGGAASNGVPTDNCTNYLNYSPLLAAPDDMAYTLDGEGGCILYVGMGI